MKANLKNLRLLVPFLIFMTACNKEIDTIRSKEIELNVIKEFPEMKKLSEIDNYKLKEQLTNTLFFANNILDSLANYRNVKNNSLTIDTSHIYEIVKQGQPRSYFFNLIPTIDDTKNFIVKLVSLRMDLGLNGQFENRLYIYSNSAKLDKVIHFNQVGQIINVHENSTNISIQSFVVEQSHTYFYPRIIFSFPSSNYPGGFSSPYVVMAAL